MNERFHSDIRELLGLAEAEASASDLPDRLADALTACVGRGWIGLQDVLDATVWPAVVTKPVRELREGDELAYPDLPGVKVSRFVVNGGDGSVSVYGPDELLCTFGGLDAPGLPRGRR